jgi:hypothetical protein
MLLFVVMERPDGSCVEIFNACRVPADRAGKVIDDACRTLLAKRRLRHEDPEGWLLRTIIESCRRGQKEEECEDPPE